MKITTLSISLLAGFFCFRATAGCLTLGGTIVPVMELGPFCPARETIQFIEHDGDKCIIQASGGWICAVDNTNGQAFGGPYRYTGFTLNEPETPPPEQQPPVNVDVPDNPVPPPLHLVGDIATSTNAIMASVNSANKNLSDFSKKMSAAMSLTAQKDEEIRNQTIRTYNQSVTNFNQLNALQSALNEVNNQADTDARLATERNTENRDLHQQTRDKIQELQTDTDVIMQEIPKLESITSTLGGVVDGVGSLQNLASQAETRDYEISDYTQNSMNNLAQRMVDYREQSYNEYNDLVSRITALNGGNEQPCGISLGDPPCPPDDGDTGGGLSPADSQALQDIETNTRLSFASSTSIEAGLDDLSDDLADTTDAVEDVEDAIDGMRSSLSDDIYYTSGQLGEKLDAINTTLQGGIGGPSGGDTVAHEKLDGIADSVGKIADALERPDNVPDPISRDDVSAQVSNMELPDYQEASDDAYTQVTDGLAQHSEQFSKVEGLTGAYTNVDSVAEFFRIAQSNCTPMYLGEHELDLCDRAPDIREVLTYIFYMLTILFLIRSTHQTIQNMRL